MIEGLYALKSHQGCYYSANLQTWHITDVIISINMSHNNNIYQYYTVTCHTTVILTNINMSHNSYTYQH